MHYPEDPPDFIFGPDDRGFLPNLENIEVSSYTRIAIDVNIIEYHLNMLNIHLKTLQIKSKRYIVF